MYLIDQFTNAFLSSHFVRIIQQLMATPYDEIKDSDDYMRNKIKEKEREIILKQNK